MTHPATRPIGIGGIGGIGDTTTRLLQLDFFARYPLYHHVEYVPICPASTVEPTMRPDDAATAAAMNDALTAQ